MQGGSLSVEQLSLSWFFAAQIFSAVSALKFHSRWKGKQNVVGIPNDIFLCRDYLG
jgi:hypothetical protein